MGVQDNLPSCPHIPDKDFGSCQPIHDAAPVSSVPQFTLSHRRLVPCILAARSGVSALDSSGAAHRGGIWDQLVSRDVQPAPFARGVLPGRQSRCRNAGLGGSGTSEQAVPAVGAHGAVRPLGSGMG